MSYHSINLVTPMHAPGQLRPGRSCSQTLSICFSTHCSSKAAGLHLHQHPHPHKEFTVRNSQEDELLNVWRRAWEGVARQLGDSLGRAEMPSSPSTHPGMFSHLLWSTSTPPPSLGTFNSWNFHLKGSRWIWKRREGSGTLRRQSGDFSDFYTQLSNC